MAAQIGLVVMGVIGPARLLAASALGRDRSSACLRGPVHAPQSVPTHLPGEVHGGLFGDDATWLRGGLAIPAALLAMT